MLVYCIMKEILTNIDKIINEHILAWVKHPYGARAFMFLIEKLCLKACLALEKLPHVEVKDGVWSLNHTQQHYLQVTKSSVGNACITLHFFVP